MTFSELALRISSSLKTGPLRDFAGPLSSHPHHRDFQARGYRLGGAKSIGVVAAVFTSAMFVLSCSTALVTENTLDVSKTTDDLYTRQIIFNLVKTKQNSAALPSQVQINSGIVLGTTTINPTVSTIPLAPMIATTIGSSTTSPTITDSNAVTRPAVSAGLSATASNNDTWNTTFLQDPEQLRRLRYLYQYGAGQITASTLLCEYPVPQLTQNQQQQANGTKRRYVRVYAVSGSRLISCGSVAALAGADPNPAFLNFPDCIICAVPDKGLNIIIKKILSKRVMTIQRGGFIPDTEDYNDKFEYVAVILNPNLMPNSLLSGGFLPPRTLQTDQRIDWLSVVQNGVDPAPNEAKRVGSSDGYAVYVYPLSGDTHVITGQAHFSEFVLAIMEALQEPAEFAKVGAPVPPITQR
jgi:hypothetical protein